MRLAQLESRLTAMQSGGATPDEIKELLDEVRDGDPDEEDWQQFHGATAGRSAPVPSAQFIGALWKPGPPVDVVDLRFNRPREVTVTIVADGSLAFANVITLVGSSTFQRTALPIPVGMPRSLQVYGSSIRVAAYAGNGGAQPTVQTVTAAISPRGVDPLGDLFPQWVSVNNVLANSYNGPTGGGVLLGASGWLQALGTGDSQEWVQGFDLATVGGLVSGTSLPLVSFGPLTSAGMPFSFDRSLRPDVFFANGLCWALSKTGTIFTTPGAGATFAVQYDWSS